jgi:hypothetical protein
MAFPQIALWLPEASTNREGGRDRSHGQQEENNDDTTPFPDHRRARRGRRRLRRPGRARPVADPLAAADLCRRRARRAGGDQAGVDMFNRAADGEMEIDLFYADQLVPTGELFQAMQRGTIDAVQSDDDSMASPTEVTVFGGYFPFASRYSARRAGAVPRMGAERDLGRGIRRRRRQAHLGRRLGSLPLHHQGPDPQRSPTCRASGSSPSPPPGRFLSAVRRGAGDRALGGRRDRAADRRDRRHRLVRASPRPTRWAGPT